MRGLRLTGEPLAHLGVPEIPPLGTVPGTIQVPGNGLPIVLGPDGPVTGGYPRLATGHRGGPLAAGAGPAGRDAPVSAGRFSRGGVREARGREYD
jgi:hypothetical protein